MHDWNTLYTSCNTNSSAKFSMRVVAITCNAEGHADTYSASEGIEAAESFGLSCLKVVVDRDESNACW